MDEADTASASAVYLSHMPIWNRPWPKILTVRCVKTSNTFKFIQFLQKQRCLIKSSLMTAKNIVALSTYKKITFSFT